ncbi:MAG TPA: LysR family transcriptional regulator [Solirubrobacteraceae bacterium]|nr:LysR family transcriptional regulator [Solirubrobacteraceae bacterium]
MSFDTRFSLYKLEVFCKVIECGGVGLAAKEMFLTQPVISAHIRSLQEHVGVRLFERKGRGLALTETGASVYGWARDVVARTHELARALEGAEGCAQQMLTVIGDQSIGSSVLPPIIGRLSKLPNVRLTLEIASTTSALAALQAGNADAAVLIGSSIGDDDGVAAEIVGYDDLVLVTHPEFPVPGPDVLTADIIRDMTLISGRGACAIEQVLAESGLSIPPSAMDFGQPEAVKHAVHERLGVAFLFRSSVEHVARTGQLQALETNPRLTAPIHLVQRAGAQRSPGQEHLIALLRRELAASLNPVSVPALRVA